MGTTRISLITPSFNQAPLIGRIIQSVPSIINETDRAHTALAVRLYKYYRSEFQRLDPHPHARETGRNVILYCAMRLARAAWGRRA